MKVMVVRLLQLLFIHSASGANVLFHFMINSYSHRASVWPLAEELAARGHNVTFASLFSPKLPNPNITEFSPPSLIPLFQNSAPNVSTVLRQRAQVGSFRSNFNLVKNQAQVSLLRCENFLTNPEVKILLETSAFDLIVIDGFFGECGFGLSYKFGSKVIIYGTNHPLGWLNEVFGLPDESSSITDFLVAATYPQTFIERTLTMLVTLYAYWYRAWVYFPQVEELLRSQLNAPDMPALVQLERDTSLVLWNTHFSEEETRSTPPFYVFVGGMHLEVKYDKIPEEISNFILESGDAGFVYVSFGGNMNPHDLRKETLEIFIKVFSESSLRFLWKWDGSNVERLPPNVLTSKWMPQKEILRSKNCKAFITHGGIHGIHEAVAFGVPMLLFPILGDQDCNAVRIEQRGRGIKLEITTITNSELRAALTELLTNPLYKENMLEASSLFNDRPQTALETAIYWTEYVLRHNSTSVLKPRAMNQAWFERRLLDVWLLLFILGTLLASVWYWTIRVVVQLVLRTFKMRFNFSNLKLKQM